MVLNLAHFLETTHVVLMMNKSTRSANKDDNTKRKASRALNLGDFGFKLVKKINGKEYSADIPEGRPAQMHKCEDCKFSFNTVQGLAGHRLHCKATKAAAAAQEEEALRKNNNMRIMPDIVMEKAPKNAHAKPPALVKGAVLINSAGGTSSIANINKGADGRKTNRGSSLRKKYTNLEKARIIELHEHAASTRVIAVAEWVRENRVGREIEKYLGKSKTGWRNNNSKISIFEKAADSKYKHVKYSTSGNKYKKSPFRVSEVEVLKLAYEYRKKG